MCYLQPAEIVHSESFEKLSSIMHTIGIIVKIKVDSENEVESERNKKE